MKQRHPLLGLLLFLGWPLEGSEAPTELERLRELEKTVTGTIESAKGAFVFIEGGSGFLISQDGYVLTNAHVVAERVARGMKSFLVQKTGGRSFQADIRGYDPEGDVALLQLKEKPDAAPLELGDSERLKVGEEVIALGDPFLIASENLFLDKPPPDYEPSASLGIVSALHRYSDTYTDAIQVDVAVNRGNSGGPLLTLDGKVVGINGKIETRFEFGINTGVGYAIPSSQIQRFIEPLKSAGGGIVRHGTIFGLVPAERADGKAGLPVERVDTGSLAEKAGVKTGDLILSIEGSAVRSRTRYHGVLGTFPAGREVNMKLARGSGSLEIKVPLIEPGAPAFLGLKTSSPDAEGGGLTVTGVDTGTPADRAGVKEKDVILLFDGKKVASTADLVILLKARAAGDEVTLELLRDGKPLELKVRLGGRLGS
jgi:S1-C subfamily serine protease